MSETMKLKYKVGAIEFEAEGPADAVERQRINFIDVVLPAAVSAMAQTQAVHDAPVLIDEVPQIPQLETGSLDVELQGANQAETDYSRTSLPMFLKKYGALNDQDFTLIAAYFDEKKNGTKAFSSENVKQYYIDGRRTAYSNNSELLRQLAKKGYIMDIATPEGAKSGKHYMLTDDGISYVEGYTPKENIGEKKKGHVKKGVSKKNSVYSSINADDLNLKAYPVVKSLSHGKEQVVMAMYIVTNEGKGEWFTVDDVIFLLTNIFEIPANVDNINGVFKRNKSWFISKQDETNKKAYQRKLLSGAKDFAHTLIEAAKK